jgi:CheY-like chemotaxis protein
MNSPYPCVMLIEDGAADNLVAEILIRKTGFAQHIITCPDAFEALAYLSGLANEEKSTGQMWPELILLDLVLPGMDGFDFLNRLEALSLPVTPPVYMLTVSLRSRDREQAATYASVRGFLLKPLTEEMLRQIME